MSTSDIKLNFINQSNDQNNSEIVIFQQNVATDFDEIAIAWQVIKNCGHGDNHPFKYPMNFSVSAGDSWGNFTPHNEAEYGQQWEMVKDASGDILKLSAQPGTDPKAVTIANNLEKGAISANVYKDGKLLAMRSGIAPQQKAMFSFKPTLWIGVVSQVEEGQVLNSAIISNINTELSLLGVASADIVMKGGGTGATASPFTFELENVEYA